MPPKVTDIPVFKAATSVLAEEAKSTLQQALVLHQQGQLPQAQALYDEILKSKPDHFDSLHLSGVIAYQTKNHHKAVELIGKALAINPDNAKAYSNLGVALKELKQFESALACYNRAIALKLNSAEVYNNRGNALQELRLFDAAVASFDQAIAIRPDYAEACFNRANALKELKQLEAAVAGYDRAIALMPDSAEVYNNRGNTLQELRLFGAAVASFDQAIAIRPDYTEVYLNRGNALQELGQFDAAVLSYDQAIALKPDYAEACFYRGMALHELKQFDAAVTSYDQAITLKRDYTEACFNRGDALRGLKQFDAAVASYEQAIALKPDYAKAYSNRGMALRELKQFHAAVASYDQAIALKPDYAEACFNRGNALRELRQLDAAVASFDRAIAIKPDYADAYWNKSLILLLDGDLDNGWKFYEWRWKTDKGASKKRNFPQPLWLGKESLFDKTIVLHSEQGLGDTIQFCRYARFVADLGAKVIMEVESPLFGLLKELAGVSELIVKGNTLPEFDYHCPLLSLPLAFKTGLHSIPCTEKYLCADTGKLSYWAKKLGDKTKPRVGLVWRGNRIHNDDHNRSTLLSALIPQILQSDYQYVSLQKEVPDVEKATLEANQNMLHFGDELKDFTDTAALCELMDMVISVDTSVAHLSGALGKPTWVLLPFSPDWRWLLYRDDSPWYPSVKLYRQKNIGDWSSVFAKVNADLVQLQK
ncbi:MAG: tetratricopeptide repeat protein [Desulfuromonadales bacterium]